MASRKPHPDFELRSLVTRALSVKASPELRAKVDAIARTEDIRFSPSGLRLAIAGFARNSILVLDLADVPEIYVEGCLDLTHDDLREPHGVEWLDDSRLVIANRQGKVQIAALPEHAKGVRSQTANIIQTFDSVGFRKRLRSPGSVAIHRQGDQAGLWVCNNYTHLMSYHPVGTKRDIFSRLRNRVAISEGLNVPDGVSISPDGRFMAISNHNTHQVFVYTLDGPGQATKIGSLNWIDYPHGLRFLPDGRGLAIADAGQPYLHVFRTETDWQGDHLPVLRLRVMDDETYLAGRYNTQEGGVKGLDIDPKRGLVVTTCELQNLQVFQLADFS